MSAELERLRQKLIEQRQLEANLRRESASLVARLRAASSNVMSVCVADLNAHLDQYRREIEPAHPAALAPWKSSSWNGFSDKQLSSIPFSLRVGSVWEQPIDAETAAQIPKLLPLLDADGALIFLCNAATRKTARDLIVTLLLRAALSAPAQMRFSLLDPQGLGSAFPMRALLPNVRPAGRGSSDELADVVDSIRRINQDVVQQDARLADLAPEKRSAELFEIVAVMDFPEGYSHDPRAIEYIVRIANSGPRAGRHLLLEFRVDKDKPRDVSMQNFTNAEVINCAELGFSPDAAPPADLIKTFLVAASAKKAQTIVGDWESVVRPKQFFAESSKDKIRTKLGERLEFWQGQEIDGTPSAHAIIAGQSGFGKSSLLHVLITGLAARYSPSELRFFLVDGKRGVEFQAYNHFPHAAVVCLQTSPAVALSVLREFHDEMRARFALFGKEDVFDLIEYRNKTGVILPRQVMVVDEYGVLLEADSERAGEYLLDILAKGRAAGTHLILSSQNFDVRLMPAEYAQHIQLRASLFLPSDEVQRLALFDPEGKRMIRELTASGQVVINDRSGRDGANTSGAVARLEPSTDRRGAVARIVREIAEATNSSASPVVLTGDEYAVLASNPFVRRWSASPPDPLTLQATARRSVREDGFGMPVWSAGDQPIPLWLGRKFDVYGHALAVLRRVPAHNLLCIGPETVFRLSMLANAFAGLRSMLPVENLEMLFLDGLRDGLPGSGFLSAGLETIEAAGARVTRLLNGATIGPKLEEFAAAHSRASHTRTYRLLLVSEPEYFPELYGGGAYGTAPAGAPRIFKELLGTGPQSGLHVIVTASSLAALSNVLYPSRDKKLFNHRVVQQMTPEESSILFDAYTATHIQSQANHVTASLYVDAVQGNQAGQLFKSYCAATSLKNEQTADELREALQATYAPRRCMEAS